MRRGDEGRRPATLDRYVLETVVWLRKVGRGWSGWVGVGRGEGVGVVWGVAWDVAREGVFQGQDLGVRLLSDGGQGGRRLGGPRPGAVVQAPLPGRVCGDANLVPLDRNAPRSH